MYNFSFYLNALHDFLYVLKELMKAVLGIRDILVKIPIPGSVPLMDPTSFFIVLRMPKKIFLYIFLLTCQQAHHLQSQKFNFFDKNFVLKFYFAGIISVRSTHL
jgi:hypothetical protein